MTTKRKIVREFICAMEWATPQNLVLLLGIKETAVRVMLSEMLRSNNPDKRLKVVHNEAGNSAYVLYGSSRHEIGTTNKFYHDCKLRNCLAALLQCIEYEGMECLKISNTADAQIGTTFFEFDNGHMDLKQLEDKIRSNYSHDGSYFAIFFMRNRQDKLELEKERVKMVFQAAENVLREKKGRVYACGYLQFMDEKIIYSWRGWKECAI